jgi:hypothetical protein
MKKFIAVLAMFFVFAVGIPTTASAYAGGKRYKKSYSGKRYKKDKRYKKRQKRRVQRRRQARRSYRRSNVGRNRYYKSSNRRSYRTQGYSYTRQQPRRRSIYRRHRNLINIGIGAGAGAIIGGIIGGKRGALIGTGVGAGAGAAYTYGIKPKKRRNRSNRRYRNR